MSHRQSPRRNVNLAGHIAAGVAGGLIASFAMERVQAAIDELWSDNGSATRPGGQQHPRQQEREPATFKARTPSRPRLPGSAFRASGSLRLARRCITRSAPPSAHYMEPPLTAVGT